MNVGQEGTDLLGVHLVVSEVYCMGRYEGLLEHIMMRRGDANVPFSALCQLLRKLGFSERVRGDHHIFTMEGIEDILNLQPKAGKAKPYQVSQVRSVFLRYRLRLGD